MGVFFGSQGFTIWFTLSFIFIYFSLSLLPYLWPRFPTSVIAWGVFIGTRQLTAELATFVVTILRPAEQEEATPDRTPSKGFSINSAQHPPQKRGPNIPAAPQMFYLKMLSGLSASPPRPWAMRTFLSQRRISVRRAISDLIYLKRERESQVMADLSHK